MHSESEFEMARNEFIEPLITPYHHMMHMMLGAPMRPSQVNKLKAYGCMLGPSLKQNDALFGPGVAESNMVS